VQFDTAEQQHETQTLGMWVFLMTEVMLFGGLFTAYTIYRIVYTNTVAEASAHLDVGLAGIMTAVLIVSSLTIALALHAARTGHETVLEILLAVTIALGTLFLALKGLEYSHHFADGLAPGFRFDYPGPNAGPAAVFFTLYYLMTGLHAVHLTIALVVVAFLFVQALRGHYGPHHYTPIELTGLYWHFVDIVWIFLLPLLYFPGLAHG
jgi:cytochrome c oxidase subunit 3